MPEGKSIEIKPAKGRPMLTWVGKRPLRNVLAYPAQLVESYSPALPAHVTPQSGIWTDWPECFPKGGLLFHGDNKDVLAYLLANGFRGKVKLIYIDPPFDSGADYVRRVTLRGTMKTAKVDSESYDLGEQVQYTDIWANDNYLQFMYERLLLVKELLSEDGSIALHCDARKGSYLRILLDEVFGSENFRGEVIVRAGVKNVQSQFETMSSLTLGNNTIFLYSKGTNTKYHKLQTISEKFEPGKWDTFWRGTDRPTMRYPIFDQKPENGQWRWAENRALTAIINYQTYLEKYESQLPLDEYYLQQLSQGIDLDFVRKSDDGVIQYFVPPRKYKLISNVWLDLPYRGTETDYPTEKNEAIARRLVEWITSPNEIVLDCFIGSGTTAAVAQKFGRHWIGADINKGAIQTTSNRLQGIIEDQIQATQSQLPLLQTEEDKPQPTQFNFSVYRVNDYDLQIQHNEALNIACEHIGITRTKTDVFFDGILGTELAKIIPFNHPLTLLDLQEIHRELENRPQEERNIVVVCLGKELATQEWIEDWNRNRKRTNLPNQIKVIEVRSDPKYGGLFVHEPAEAEINIQCTQDSILVEINNFISPTIIERLSRQAGIIAPKVEDWRAMVDSIMIDTAYNGEVFNIVLADIPEKKTDLVSGKYKLPAPEAQTTIAVKITDMLGEEVLVTKQV